MRTKTQLFWLKGPVIACRLIAHKIQSPQEREAVYTLAVLEACVKSCGPVFHNEVGKFKFLNEMIKLVSPRYLANRTPEHIKKKVIEMLFVWTRGELKHEAKIGEAYQMLKVRSISYPIIYAKLTKNQKMKTGPLFFFQDPGHR